MALFGRFPNPGVELEGATKGPLETEYRYPPANSLTFNRRSRSVEHLPMCDAASDGPVHDGIAQKRVCPGSLDEGLLQQGLIGILIPQEELSQLHDGIVAFFRVTCP